MSAFLKEQGYTIKVFHLVTPAASDSWNCLSESEGPELMAQLFVMSSPRTRAAAERPLLGQSRVYNRVRPLK